MLSSQARRFGEALVDRHVLTREEMESALDHAFRTGRAFPDVLAERIELSEKDHAAGWAASQGIRFVDFAVDVVRPRAAAALPAELCRSHRVIGVRHEDEGLLVVFAAPIEAAALDAVSDHLKQRGDTLIVGTAAGTEIDDALGAVLGGVGPGIPGAAPAAARGPSSAVDELYRLFGRVLELDASDLHLAANQPPFVRLVGELVRMPDEPVLTAGQVREMVFSILTTRQKERFEQTHELDTSHAMGDRVRFRVNVYVQRNAVGAAFRVIPYQVVPFDRLGLPEVVRTFADVPRGLVLVTGPTGSGKSSTLAALVDIVNETRQCHIMTIEDPIEFVHRSKRALVNQRELGEDTDSFAAALRASLRQDPDVIMVGEMRDLETIATAITAAETGHLVFATLHTQDASQTIDRIIDVFPAEQQGQVRIQLANSLQGISTQQLVPTVDRRSRAVACEILLPTSAVRTLIREGKVHQIPNQIQTGRRIGMQSIDDSLAELARNGVCSVDEVMKRARNLDEVGRQLGIRQSDQPAGGPAPAGPAPMGAAAPGTAPAARLGRRR